MLGGQQGSLPVHTIKFLAQQNSDHDPSLPLKFLLSGSHARQTGLL